MSLTWHDKIFQITKTQSGFMAHCTDSKGVIIFRWRMYYTPYPPNKKTDAEISEEFNLPFGVIEHFETFKALCRQFDTPEDARAWLKRKLEQ